MSTIDNTSAAATAQQQIFDKLGISTDPKTGTDRANGANLGQQDFLKIMTTQMQNQDPFAPMENGDFIAQMAQFSTVSGIQDVNKSLQTLTEQMKQMRIATASNLLGAQVLVPGNLARPDQYVEIHGLIDLPSASQATKIIYSDSSTGEVFYEQDLGAQASGLTGFSWTAIPPEVKDSGRPVKISVTVNSGKGVQSLGPSVYARVLSASVDGDAGDGVMLDVQDYGELNADEVARFR